MTLPDFQFIIIITVTILVAVLNRFSWNSHGRYEFTHGWTQKFFFFFWKKLVQYNPWYGGKVPPKLFFRLSFSWYGVFWGKNFKAVFGTPFPIENVIFVFVVRHRIPWKKGHAPQKLFFAVILDFFFNCYMKNIQNLISYKKVYIEFYRQTPRLSKWSCPPTNGFSQFFQHKLKNIREVFLLESILIRKEILWRINIVPKIVAKCIRCLAGRMVMHACQIGPTDTAPPCPGSPLRASWKPLPNALLFEKLQNEYKNPSFLHKVTCIRSDHTGAVVKFHIHGFVLLEALGKTNF